MEPNCVSMRLVGGEMRKHGAWRPSLPLATSRVDKLNYRRIEGKLFLPSIVENIPYDVCQIADNLNLGMQLLCRRQRTLADPTDLNAR